MLVRAALLLLMTLGCGPGDNRAGEGKPAETPRASPPASREAASPSSGPVTLLERESPYHLVRVTQTGNVRQLQFRRRGTDYDESAINTAQPLHFELHYYSLMFAGFAHQPDPKAILFVGLGGGTLPMAMQYYFPQARIDAVELDPVVVSAARQFFGFQENDRLKVFVRDGRVQLRQFTRENKRYDIVFLDAFRGGFIPYHLTTKEFMEEVKELLSVEGVVVSNLQPGFESYHYQRRTLAAVFRNQWSYGEGGNVIVVADARRNPPTRSQLVANAERLQREKAFVSFDLPAIVREVTQNGYERQGPILTDDYAPADVLRSIPRE